MSLHKTVYRFTFQGRGMPKPARRYLSTRGLAVSVRQILNRIGCAVSPIDRVRVISSRVLDDARYPDIPPATEPKTAELHLG